MQQQKEIINQILNQLEQDSTITTKDQLYKITNEILKISGAPISPPLFQILAGYRERLVTQSKKSDPRIAKLLRKRAVRSLSGVSVISLLTKFWGCPGKCVYCPTFDTLPKSYVPSEPAVMRAEHNDFDTVRQIQNRLRSLEITGHIVEKCDIRVIGGTWSVYPVEYQEAVMRDIYDAHTTYAELAPHIEAVESGDRLAGFRVKKGYQMRASETLLEAQKRNESAASRVIGIAIETRPDSITPEEIARLRNYGVTRVEIGYQTTDDHVNAVNRRGHGNVESMRATQLLKDAGFKVVAHMMPNLLESTPEIDRASMREVFDNPGYAPDELKIYPMVVTDKSELTEIWRNGGFTPYPDDLLIDLMADLESYLPLWVRLNRSYRDIPAEQILAGSKLSNLRELTETSMRHK
jgi:elongator complex protein 3